MFTKKEQRLIDRYLKTKQPTQCKPHIPVLNTQDVVHSDTLSLVYRTTIDRNTRQIPKDIPII